MRCTVSLLVAASSLLAAAGLTAAERPRYGGTLRIEMQAAVQSLDSADAPEALDGMVFEPLVRMDERGQPQPELAVSWQSDQGGRRWLLRLRSGVKFHDGSALTPASVAAALNAVRNGWQASATADGVTIQSDHPQPDLLAELSGTRYSIVAKAADGTPLGTGPFRIAQWEAGRRALLNANEDYWGGRPFLDAVSIEMGRTTQQQMLDLELGKADLIEIRPQEVRRATQETMKLWLSSPVVLLAIEFERGRPAVDDSRLREAIALSVDRAAIQGVLLQKQGEPAGGLLPQWLSGYAFLFKPSRDAARARQLAASMPASTVPLILGYDGGDPLARSIAERIAVNAREAGMRLQASPQVAQPDLRLVRIRIRSVEAADALVSVASRLGLAEALPPGGLANPEACYEAERALVEDFRVIPLVHLPEIFVSRPAVKTWQTPGLLRTGAWRLDDIWLAPERP
jgi:peptide/nickel transport system substrate-binding protein